MKMNPEQFKQLLEDLANSKKAIEEEMKSMKDFNNYETAHRLYKDMTDFLKAADEQNEVKIGWTIMRMAVHAEDACEVSLVAKNMWQEMQKFIH